MPLLCAIAIVRPEMKVIRGDSSVLLPGSSLQSARASKNYNLILFKTISHPPDSFVSKNEGMAEDGPHFLAYVEQILAPTLKKGQIVFLDNVSTHKVDGVEEAVEARGARAVFL